MLNMIRLNWLGMKTYHLMLLVVPIGAILIGFIVSEYIIIPLTALLMWSCAVYPFVVEEKGKLDNLYLTLPVHRKSIVSARFGLSLFMVLAGIVFGVVLTIAMPVLFNGPAILYPRMYQPSLDTILLLISIGLFSYTVMLLCAFPILFKLGYAKGKIIGFYVPAFGGSIIFVITFQLLINIQFDAAITSTLVWAMTNTLWAALIIFAAAAALFALAYVLSVKAFAKREL